MKQYIAENTKIEVYSFKLNLGVVIIPKRSKLGKSWSLKVNFFIKYDPKYSEIEWINVFNSKNTGPKLGSLIIFRNVLEKIVGTATKPKRYRTPRLSDENSTGKYSNCVK
jgi:hypothetical protein